jgi:membrane-bound serine protease (ClpP class)
MRRLAPFVLLAAVVFLFGARSASAATQPSEGPASNQPIVDVVKVDGVIDGSMRDYLLSTIDDAERDGSQVVIQLDTAGALNVDAVEVAQRIASSRVPVVVWIGPGGARATGAGLLMVASAGLSVISPGSGVGPLEPIDLGNVDATATPQEAAAIASIVAQGGAGPAVGHVLPAQQALLRGVVDCARDVRFTGSNPQDCAAIDVPDLLAKIDGRTVRTAVGPVTLATKVEPARPVLVRFHDLGIWRRILHGVSAPTPIYVLLILGLAGIAFELTQAGIGFAGIAGALALALAGYGLAVVPFDALGLVLFLGGTGLLVADVRLRRLGVLSALGMVGFVVGSALVFRHAAPAIRLSPWLIAGASVAAALYYGFGLTVAVKARERIVSTQVGLVGLTGETRGLLDPEGPVFVKGTLWRGKSGNGPIPPGTRVRIRGVDGLILRVEPEEGGGPGPPSPN